MARNSVVPDRPQPTTNGTGGVLTPVKVLCSPMSSAEPLFTVIIATFNRSAFLAEAVDSVLGQTVQDFECVVVDDAGSIAATVVDHPKVRLVRRAVNGGQGASFNTGMTEGRGRHFVFLDDDDLFT